MGYTYLVTEQMVTVTQPAAEDVFLFEWQCDRAGYKAERRAPGSKARASDVLLGGEVILRPVSGEPVPCRPLKESDDLAREFADVADGAEAAEAFCNRHGLLWSAPDMPLSEFTRARDRVRSMLWIIDSYADLDRRASTLAAHWHREGNPDWRKYRKGDALAGAASIFEERERPTFALRLAADSQGRRSIRLAPTSLLDAIWLLVAQEIVGELEWTNCQNCGRRFARGPGGTRRRRDAVYCSDPCQREADNARRQAERPKVKAPKAKKKCPYCGDRYTEKRTGTGHCGKPACKTAHWRAKQASDVREARK